MSTMEMDDMDPEDVEREQLPDDSDFQIHYDFQEVEIDFDQDEDDLAEEELLDDEGTVVGSVAIPINKFWMVMAGALVFTVAFGILLVIMLGEGQWHLQESSDSDN